MGVERHIMCEKHIGKKAGDVLYHRIFLMQIEEFFGGTMEILFDSAVSSNAYGHAGKTCLLACWYLKKLKIYSHSFGNKE